MTVDRTVVASRRLWELFETLHDVMYFIECTSSSFPTGCDPWLTMSCDGA